MAGYKPPTFLPGSRKFLDSEVAGATDGRLHCWDCSMGVLGAKQPVFFSKNYVNQPTTPPPKKKVTNVRRK